MKAESLSQKARRKENCTVREIAIDSATDVATAKVIHSVKEGSSAVAVSRLLMPRHVIWISPSTSGLRQHKYA